MKVTVEKGTRRQAEFWQTVVTVISVVGMTLAFIKHSPGSLFACLVVALVGVYGMEHTYNR